MGGNLRVAWDIDPSDSMRNRNMIAQELEVSLHMAFVEARQKAA